MMLKCDFEGSWNDGGWVDSVGLQLEDFYIILPHANLTVASFYIFFTINSDSEKN